MSGRYLILVAAMLIARSAPADDPHFLILPDLPGFPDFPSARDVSNTGAVVGSSKDGVLSHAWRWSDADGIMDLGTIDGANQSSGTGISADGSVLVGQSTSFSGQGWRWTSQSGLVGLGVLPGAATSRAQGINSAGSIIVGRSGMSGSEEAVYWTTPGRIVGIGKLDGDDRAEAVRTSEDGSVIVGISEGAPGDRAFRWTLADGMAALPLLDGGVESRASGISADGAAIFGVTTLTNGKNLATRWTEGGLVIEDLGNLPLASHMFLNDASADGRRAVGQAVGASLRAFMWIEGQGMLDLNDVAIGLGLDLGEWTLTSASGISSDGLTIVGNASMENAGGFINRPYILRVPAPSTAVVLAGGFALGRRRRRRPCDDQSAHTDT